MSGFGAVQFHPTSPGKPWLLRLCTGMCKAPHIVSAYYVPFSCHSDYLTQLCIPSTLNTASIYVCSLLHCLLGFSCLNFFSLVSSLTPKGFSSQPSIPFLHFQSTHQTVAVGCICTPTTVLTKRKAVLVELLEKANVTTNLKTTALLIFKVPNIVTSQNISLKC